MGHGHIGTIDAIFAKQSLPTCLYNYTSNML